MLKFCLACALIAGVLTIQSNARFTARKRREQPQFQRAAPECDKNPFKECGQFLPSEELNEIQGVPNGEELNAVCPGLQEFAYCILDYISACHLPIPQSDLERLKAPFALIGKLCNQDSSLHKRYTANAQCLKKLKAKEAGPTCEKNADDVYDLYRTSSQANLPLLPEPTAYEHKHCMEISFTMACIANEARKECGDEAFLLFLDIIKEMKVIESSCTLPHKAEAKGAFLESIPAEDRSSIASAFQNLLERRKRTPGGS